MTNTNAEQPEAPTRAPSRLVIALSTPTDIERELDWGAVLARTLHVPITLLCLLDPGVSREPADRAAAMAADLLAIAASDERLADLEVRTEVRIGLPGEELRGATEAEPGVVALMLADTPGMLRRALLGTDAHAVIRSLRSPFIILPSSAMAAAPIERAVVGYDGSALSERVLETSTRLAALLGVTLTVVEVIEPSGAHGADFLDLQPQIGAERIVARGRAGETLVAAARARRAGLIVVGSHGRGQMTRLLLGSTSEWLADHADRPVLIVPQREWGGAAHGAEPTR